MSEQVTNLIAFLAEATTPFHTVSALSWRLAAAGFIELEQIDGADLQPGSGYFITRNDSSIVAFRVGQQPVSEGVRLIGAHTDSPNLSVKPNPVKVRQGVVQVAVDVYGGALLNPWFDRDLSMAGRVNFVDESGALQAQLIDFAAPIAVIPSLAIHLDREANQSRSVNPQKDILPVLLTVGPDDSDSFSFGAMLAEQVRKQYPEYGEVRVLDYEISLYDSQKPACIGLNGDFVASARLDNLLSCHAGMTALINADPHQWSVLVCNDHEEVGSASAVGAQGPMLQDVLAALAGSPAAYRALRGGSVMLSVDNAHAVHPNFSDRHDESHGPLLNRGPVIKINRNQRYATNSEGSALLRLLAERVAVPVQSFVMRTDLACGSTIGPITAAETGIATIDLGIPTLGMHSIRELAGAADIDYLTTLLTGFYNRVA